MHSNVHFMLRKLAATVPFGIGAFAILGLADYGSRVPRPEVSRPEVPRLILNNNHLIHLITNQFKSL